MAQITLKGNPINTSGDLPEVGADAPDFTLVAADMSEKKGSDYAGRAVVLNIFPSIDTPVCANSVRAFNEKAAGKDAVVLCISADLPFAAGRFCGAEGIENVVTLSTFRNPQFGKDYGMTIVDGPLAGVLGRAVVVVGPDGNVKYTELVPEIGQEPDYDAALAAV
ncbi:MAG: thiol peroxidase [Acidobacteriota bacterium]|jgi:thiol peroxidase